MLPVGYVSVCVVVVVCTVVCMRLQHACAVRGDGAPIGLSLIHISEPTRPY